jgi:hypothetical protein
MSKSCQKVVKKLSKSCQKVVKKLSKSCQKVVQKLKSERRNLLRTRIVEEWYRLMMMKLGIRRLDATFVASSKNERTCVLRESPIWQEYLNVHMRTPELCNSNSLFCFCLNNTYSEK